MEAIRAGGKKEQDAYEISPDGRVKVNISKLVKSQEVQDFYASLRPSGGKEKVGKK